MSSHNTWKRVVETYRKHGAYLGALQKHPHVMKTPAAWKWRMLQQWDKDREGRSYPRFRRSTVHERTSSDPSAQNRIPSTPFEYFLFLAAKRGNEEMLRSLLDVGADPNARNLAHSTALHVATLYSQPALVALLLQRGADPVARDAKGRTPMDLAKEVVLGMERPFDTHVGPKEREKAGEVYGMLATWKATSKIEVEESERATPEETRSEAETIEPAATTHQASNFRPPSSDIVVPDRTEQVSSNQHAESLRSCTETLTMADQIHDSLTNLGDSSMLNLPLENNAFEISSVPVVQPLDALKSESEHELSVHEPQTTEKSSTDASAAPLTMETDMLAVPESFLNAVIQEISPSQPNSREHTISTAGGLERLSELKPEAGPALDNTSKTTADDNFITPISNMFDSFVSTLWPAGPESLPMVTSSTAGLANVNKQDSVASASEAGSFESALANLSRAAAAAAERLSALESEVLASQSALDALRKEKRELEEKLRVAVADRDGATLRAAELQSKVEWLEIARGDLEDAKRAVEAVERSLQEERRDWELRFVELQAQARHAEVARIDAEQKMESTSEKEKLIEGKLTNAQRELERSESARATMMETEVALQDQLSKFKGELESQKADFAATEAAHAQLKRDVEHFQEVTAKLRKHVRTQEERIEDELAANAHLREKVFSGLNHIRDVQEQLDVEMRKAAQAITQVEQLTESVDSLKQSNTILDEERKSLAIMVDEKSELLESTQRQLEAVRTERGIAEARAVDALREKEEMISRLQKYSQQLMRRVEIAEREAMSHRAQMDSVVVEAVGLRAMIEFLRTRAFGTGKSQEGTQRGPEENVTSEQLDRHHYRRTRRRSGAAAKTRARSKSLDDDPVLNGSYEGMWITTRKTRDGPQFEGDDEGKREPTWWKWKRPFPVVFDHRTARAAEVLTASPTKPPATPMEKEDLPVSSESVSSRSLSDSSVPDPSVLRSFKTAITETKQAIADLQSQLRVEESLSKRLSLNREIEVLTKRLEGLKAALGDIESSGSDQSIQERDDLTSSTDGRSSWISSSGMGYSSFVRVPGLDREQRLMHSSFVPASEDGQVQGEENDSDTSSLSVSGIMSDVSFVSHP
ncbi:Ankyrin repeat domain-containing protein 22 [Gonapodya sp. JEL0774]|nr:Ankyrin repeat domain-containing protein 22 [Gonapodya sp. JEL0774]